MFINKPSIVSYVVSGGSSVFPFEFKFYADTDIIVFRTPVGQVADNDNDRLAVTDYTINSNASKVGGDVTVTIALTDGDIVTVQRSLPITRTVEYTKRGSFTASNVNNDNDYQTYLILDQFALTETYLKVPVGNVGSGIDFTFPSPEASKVIGWNPSGDGLENKTIGENDVVVNVLNVDVYSDLSTVDTSFYTTVNVKGYSVINDSNGGVYNFIGGDWVRQNRNSMSAMMLGANSNLIIDIDTITDTPIDGDSIFFVGYRSFNDGGGGRFIYDSSLIATNNGGTIINGWVRQHNGTIDIREFGASESFLNNSIYIQNAIDFFPDGVVIKIPIGVWKLGATIKIEHSFISIIGEGKGSVLSQRFNGDVIDVSSATIRVYGCILRDFTTRPDITSVISGSAITADTAIQLTIDNVTIDDAFIGLTLKGCGQSIITNLLCLYESDNGGVITGRKYVSIEESLSGISSGKHGGDIFFDNFNGRCGGSNYCEIGVQISGIDGIWFDSFHIGNCTTANMYITHNPAQDVKTTGILVENGWFDIGEARGVLIDTDTGSEPMGEFLFDGCKFLGGTTGLHGFDIRGGARNISISDCTITDYANTAILVDSGFFGYGEVLDCTIRDCSRAGAGVANAIYIQSNSRWTIRNNHISGVNHSKHIYTLVDMDEAYIDYNILGKDYTSSSAMTLLTKTATGIISQKDNVGFNPYGAVLESVGTSPYTYTNPHGFPVQVYTHGAGITDYIVDGVDINGMTSLEYNSILQPNASITVTYTGGLFMYEIGI